MKLRYAASDPRDLATCTVVEAELRFGAKAQSPPAQVMRIESFLANVAVLPFDRDAVRAYGELRARLERSGQMIGGNDLMIASIALAHKLILITHNVAEFTKVPGLDVEDWEA